MEKEMMHFITEDFLDDAGAGLQKDISADIVASAGEVHREHSVKDFTHYMKITMCVNAYTHYGDESGNIVFDLKGWIKFMDEIFGMYPLFDSFYIGQMRIEDANHSASRNWVNGTDLFSEDFYAPLPDKFDLNAYYTEHGKSVYGMLPYIYFYVWFNPCEKMPYKRFVDQYNRMSTAMWKKYTLVGTPEINIDFAFYEFGEKYSICGWALHAGSVQGIDKFLRHLYKKLWPGSTDDAEDDEYERERVARNLGMKVTERLSYYTDGLMTYAQQNYGLKYIFENKWEEQLMTSEVMKERKRTELPVPGKILGFKVEPAAGTKEIKLSVLEDTVINGFMLKLPAFTARVVYFVFVIQVMGRLVDDTETKRTQDLENAPDNTTRRTIDGTKNKLFYNIGTNRSVWTRPMDIYNENTKKRKEMWKVRECNIERTLNSFDIIFTDKNGTISRGTYNFQLRPYSTLKNYWSYISDLIDKMNGLDFRTDED